MADVIDVDEAEATDISAPYPPAPPGFEDFDYEPAKEGAGEDYIEALQTPRDGVGKGKKMLRKGAELLSLRKGAEGALEASLLSQPQPS